jgi:serine/threonine protein kinase
MSSILLDRVGDYEILRQIGEGSFSKVLLGRSVVNGHEAAIKVLA